VEMNKQKFLKFMIDEIERQQKDVYKTGEGKKLVTVLSQIYTLASDGKFDVYSNHRDVSDEIRSVKHDSKNYNKGQITGSYKKAEKRIFGQNSGGE